MLRPALLSGVLVTALSLFASTGQLAQADTPAAKSAACTWGGIYPTVVTPWRCEGGVDEASLAAQIEGELRGGVHGLLVLGTIGEGEYATMEERAAVIRVAVKTAKGCVPVIVGIHTCDIDEAAAQAQQAKQFGAKAVLVKYKGNPCASCDQVLAFFAELDEKADLPIFYYHYPAQTGLKLDPCCIAQILGLEGVVGIKESTLDLRETEQHLALTHGLGRAFLSGTALNLTQFMDLGGHGAMSAEAVLLPCTAVGAYTAYVTGDREEASRLQGKLFAAAPVLRGGLTQEHSTRLLFTAAQNHQIPLPMGGDHPQARLKYALNFLCVPTQPIVKCPLPPLSRLDVHKVERAARKLCDECYLPACSAPAESKALRAAKLIPD